jgi:hypothetical protein
MADPDQYYHRLIDYFMFRGVRRESAEGTLCPPTSWLLHHPCEHWYWHHIELTYSGIISMAQYVVRGRLKSTSKISNGCISCGTVYDIPVVECGCGDSMLLSKFGSNGRFAAAINTLHRFWILGRTKSGRTHNHWLPSGDYVLIKL